MSKTPELSPIQHAAIAVDNLPWDGQHGGMDPDNVEIARAVFESIDRDEIADAILARYTSFDPISSRGIADAIRAYLLGTDEGGA